MMEYDHIASRERDTKEKTVTFTVQTGALNGDTLRAHQHPSNVCFKLVAINMPVRPTASQAAPKAPSGVHYSNGIVLMAI